MLVKTTPSSVSLATFFSSARHHNTPQMILWGYPAPMSYAAPTPSSTSDFAPIPLSVSPAVWSAHLPTTGFTSPQQVSSPPGAPFPPPTSALFSAYIHPNAVWPPFTMATMSPPALWNHFATTEFHPAEALWLHHARAGGAPEWPPIKRDAKGRPIRRGSDYFD
eukprot:GGOE01003884.1.p1 GENE.GGOE01003884.1~~GGOE01003884.1.p1  ORF type:complete len:164 (+),score=11.43 GGOE01003884.1:110-601(+)